VAQTRRAGSDGNRQIQSEEGFSELRFAADDSDGLIRPQPGNEPALLLGTISETISQLDGQLSISIICVNYFSNFRQQRKLAAICD
jgi:hypothetical protein